MTGEHMVLTSEGWTSPEIVDESMDVLFVVNPPTKQEVQCRYEH